MAAALAKVLRGGRSGASSQLLLPAIGRLMPQKGVAPLLPHLGSSPSTPAAGMGRLMHTGQWHNSGLPEQKVWPFGRGVLSEQHKLGTMEQFGSKRCLCNKPEIKYGLNGLKHSFMRVPGYEAYGSKFIILHLFERFDSINKAIMMYRNRWYYSAGLLAMVAGVGLVVVVVNDDQKEKKEAVTEFKGSVRKVSNDINDIADMLKKMKEDVSCKLEAAKKHG